MQLILTFIILSTITLIAVLLIVLSKNSRSGKVRNLAQENNWQYQEFIDFSDSIKEANFGLLNYSQNAVFRHFIRADDDHFGLGFNSFDCRALEPSGIHNSSIILFNLKLDTEFQNLHLNVSRHSQDKDSFTDISNLRSIQYQYRQQKLTALAAHQIPKAFLDPLLSSSKVEIHANDSGQAYQFLHRICSNTEKEKSLVQWLLAYPHLHIEISNGMLMAYQKNHLIEDASLLAAIAAIAELALILSQGTSNSPSFD